MQHLTKQYREYLGSLQWHAKREAALLRSGHKCERCGANKGLEVHHKHYRTLFHEQPEDLEVLCFPCHGPADERRRRNNHREAGLNTYAAKKYGEDWHSMKDPDLVAEEFDDWRERRSEY